MTPTGRALGPEDWAAAALDAMREGGAGEVRVEAIARRIGATKGSFYWHFGSRSELLAAALQRWEELETDAVIAEIDASPVPQAKLRSLLGLVARAAGPTDLGVVLARDAAHDEQVADALGRVVARRTAYVAGLLVELGWEPERANERAVLVYSSYVGLATLSALPGWRPPDGYDADRFAEELMALTEADA